MPGGQPANWKIIIPQKFSHRSESSEPHVRLPSLGVWQQEEELPETLALKASRVWLQEFHRTGGNRNSTRGRAHTRSHVHQDPGKKQRPHNRLGQTYLLVLEGLLQRREAAVAHCGDKDTGEYSLAWALLEATVFSPRPRPTQQPVLGHLRPNNQQGGNAAPPINR